MQGVIMRVFYEEIRIVDIHWKIEDLGLILAVHLMWSQVKSLVSDWFQGWHSVLEHNNYCRSVHERLRTKVFIWRVDNAGSWKRKGSVSNFVIIIQLSQGQSVTALVGVSFTTCCNMEERQQDPYRWQCLLALKWLLTCIDISIIIIIIIIRLWLE